MTGKNPLSQAVVTFVVQACKRRGWTQLDLAERIRETGAAWSNWRMSNLTTTGRRDGAALTLDEAKGIASALGMTLNELVAAAFAECPGCEGTPPAGFTCSICGTATPRRPIA